MKEVELKKENEKGRRKVGERKRMKEEGKMN
jgi:hypothetical protein